MGLPTGLYSHKPAISKITAQRISLSPAEKLDSLGGVSGRTAAASPSLPIAFCVVLSAT